MHSIQLTTLVFVFSACVFAQNRMPQIQPDKQTPDQKKAFEVITKTRGPAGAAGPFIPLLRSPEFMNRIQAVGAYLRFDNSLPQKLVEMTILMTARHLTQQYEWDSHYPLAMKAGLKPEHAAAIAAGRHPEGLAEDEDMMYNYVTELLQNKSVSDATYGRMVAKFGEQGAVDGAGTVGYYLTVGLVLNVARTPSDVGAGIPQLPLFPH
jgi:4-carboxymuconolactone decarboxylase